MVGRHAAKNKPKESTTFRAIFTGRVYQCVGNPENLAPWLFLEQFKWFPDAIQLPDWAAQLERKELAICEKMSVKLIEMAR